MSLMDLIAGLIIVAVVGGLIYAVHIKDKRGGGRSKAEGVQIKAHTEEGEKPRVQKVVITDIQMPIDSMFIFMVKWTIAAIPAAIVLGVLAFIVLAALGGSGRL